MVSMLGQVWRYERGSGGLSRLWNAVGPDLRLDPGRGRAGAGRSQETKDSPPACGFTEGFKRTITHTHIHTNIHIHTYIPLLTHTDTFANTQRDGLRSNDITSRVASVFSVVHE